MNDNTLTCMEQRNSSGKRTYPEGCQIRCFPTVLSSRGFAPQRACQKTPTAQEPHTSNRLPSTVDEV